MLGRYKQFRNLMIRFKILIVFRLIGLIALGLGIKTMLQAPTLILAPQFLVFIIYANSHSSLIGSWIWAQTRT
jgi:hypothetical protein